MCALRTMRLKCVTGRVGPCIFSPLGMISPFHLTDDISCTLGEISESGFGVSTGSMMGRSFTHQDDKHVVKAVEGKLRNLRGCPSIDYGARFWFSVLSYAVVVCNPSRTFVRVPLVRAVLYARVFACVRAQTRTQIALLQLQGEAHVCDASTPRDQIPILNPKPLNPKTLKH
jgi:hypothetical protein